MSQVQPAIKIEGPNTILHGPWLVVAWVAWVALIGISALALATFVAVERFSLEIRSTQSNVVVFVVTLAWLVIFGAAAAMILWRRYNDWVALLVALALVSFPMIATDSEDGAFLAAHSEWVIPFFFRTLLVGPPLLILLFVFPNGRLIPRWSVAIVPVWIAAVIFIELIDSPANKILLINLFWGGIFVLGVTSQVYRFWRVSNQTERHQTKWVIMGLAGLISGVLVWGIGIFALPSLSGTVGPIDAIGDTSFGRFGRLFEIGAGVLMFALPLAMPLTLMLAILRYRLWDIDLVINRALVYGVLTGILVGTYFGSVVLLQMAFRAVAGEGNGVAIVISTLAIAALFMPLRRGVQNTIDRRFYRRKYDTARTLEALSARMRDEVDLEHLGDQLVTIVENTMQPAHVSLWLRSPSSERAPSERGTFASSR